MVNAPKLYYDGPCHLCQRSVQWVRRRMPEVECVPLQSEDAQSVLPSEWTTPPLLGVVVVDVHGQIHVGHKGLHALASHAKGPWRWLLRLMPGWGYALVARTRRIWGRDDACSVG